MKGKRELRLQNLKQWQKWIQGKNETEHPNTKQSTLRNVHGVLKIWTKALYELVDFTLL